MKFYEEVIKDFGGYDAAKKLAERKESALLHNIEGLKAHLLNYRRANNIFEAGDIITYNDSDFIYRIDTINSDGFHATTVHPVKRCIIALFDHDNINHATPEEIKAGHRL